MVTSKTIIVDGQDLRIDAPTSGQTVILRSASTARHVFVRGLAYRGGVSADCVVAQAFEGAAPSNPDPDVICASPGAWSKLEVDSVGNFSGTVIGPDNANCAAPTNFNIRVAAIYSTPPKLVLATITGLLGITQTHELSATQCVWFNHAADGVTGPWGEEVENHRPLALVVTEGQTIQIITEGLWRHGDEPSEISGPDGRARVEGVRGEYFAAIYNNMHMSGIVTNLNKVIGAWERPDGSGGFLDCLPFPVGSGRTTIAPPAATHLLIGHHDGFEWNNNNGDLVLASCPPLVARVRQAK